MVKVLQICTAPDMGGMQRIVCGIGEGLTEHGVTNRVMFPRTDASDELLEWCRQRGADASCDAAVLDAADPHSFRSALRLRRLVRAIRPAVVHVHYGDNFISLWDVLGLRLSGRRLRIITSVHGISSNNRKDRLTAVASLLINAVTAFTGHTTESLVAARVPRRRVHTIACGIPAPARSPSKVVARKQLGISPDAGVVGTMARLVRSKAIDVAIEAMDAPAFDGMVLLVGGDGPDLERLRMLGANCRHLDVRFLGLVDDIDIFFAACDLFTLPSRREGFGLVFVEAAQRGVPSVATRVGGIPEAVLDEETGLLVDADDVRGLRRSLCRLVRSRDERIRLADAARLRALREFSQDRMVERFLRLYFGGRSTTRAAAARVVSHGGVRRTRRRT